MARTSFFWVKICEETSSQRLESNDQRRWGAYIDADQVDLGMTVLSGLGGGHVNDLARTSCKSADQTVSSGRFQPFLLTLDDDVSVFAQSRALHGEGEGGTSARLRCR